MQHPDRVAAREQRRADGGAQPERAEELERGGVRRGRAEHRVRDRVEQHRRALDRGIGPAREQRDPAEALRHARIGLLVRPRTQDPSAPVLGGALDDAQVRDGRHDEVAEALRGLLDRRAGADAAQRDQEFEPGGVPFEALAHPRREPRGRAAAGHDEQRDPPAPGVERPVGGAADDHQRKRGTRGDRGLARPRAQRQRDRRQHEQGHDDRGADDEVGDEQHHERRERSGEKPAP